jgi:hypothetical protein
MPEPEPCNHQWFSHGLAHLCGRPTGHEGPHRCDTDFRGMECGEELCGDADDVGGSWRRDD